MKLLSNRQKNQARLVMASTPEGIVSVRVKRVSSGMPVVEMYNFFATSTPISPEALGKLGKELQVSSYPCATILGGLEYQILSVDAPNVPAAELKSAMRWRLKDMLDFPVEEATIEILHIPVDKNTLVHTKNIFVIACRNEVITRHQNMFFDAKINLSVIDIPEMAQRNISKLIEVDGLGVAMLSFGTDCGLLTVTFNGELYLSRRIDVSLLKIMETEQEKKIANFDKIALELQRSLDNFDRQFHFINIIKLILSPMPDNGLLEYLSENLYAPVESMDLADLLDLKKVPLLQDISQQQRYFYAIGASLRHEGASL